MQVGLMRCWQGEQDGDLERGDLRVLAHILQVVAHALEGERREEDRRRSRAVKILGVAFGSASSSLD